MKSIVSAPQHGVAIIGCGSIGSSWSVVFARGGHRVQIYDRESAAVEKASRFIAETLVDMEKTGAIDNAAMAIRNISFTETLEEAVAGVYYVQESVAEVFEEKMAIFLALDRATPAEVILASSCSGLMASRFMSGVTHRGRCLVAHPANPPHLLPIVEVVACEWSEPAKLAACVEFMRANKQIPVVLKRELPGFVMNRLQVALLSEAIHLISREIVSVEDLETIVSESIGRRLSVMGLFESVDLNSSAGFAEFIGKFGAGMQVLARSLGVQRAWSASVVATIEGYLRSKTPVHELDNKRKVMRFRGAAELRSGS